MKELQNLEELALQLKTCDRHIVSTIKRRMVLAGLVCEYKMKNNQPIVRASVEDARLCQVAEWAEEIGLNVHFAKATMYNIIGESCKVQQIAKESSHQKEPLDEEEYYSTLKNNLLTLAERWSKTYDASYESAYTATRLYIEYERECIMREIEYLDDKAIAIDIGCATGRLTNQLGKHFKQAIGYDISPHMITEAKKDNANNKTIFINHDIEDGIPLEDNVVTFVVMNIGTTSDIKNISFLMSEIQRVLAPGGRFFLSFYNTDAYIYRWHFFPWQLPLAAEFDRLSNCLYVHSENERLGIYARSYTRDEISTLIPNQLTISSVKTYPTISSWLPEEMMDDADVMSSMRDMEDCLATANTSGGAYIMVTGQKEE